MRLLALLILWSNVAFGQVVLFEWFKGTNSAAPSNQRPTASSLSLNKTTGVYTASLTYADNESDVRATPLPYIMELSINGTLNTGTNHTATYTYVNASGISESGSTIKWYLADDLAGTNQTLASTSSTYSPSDDTKFLKLGVIPRSSLGETGVERQTIYYDLKSSFNPWTDIAWAIAFDWHSSYDTDNKGTDGDAVSSTIPPVYDATNSALLFVRASSENVKSLAPTGYTTPITMWLLCKMPSATSGTQGLVAMSNTHRASWGSNGHAVLSATDTGVTLSVSTWYVIQWVLNGASSSYSIVQQGSSMPAVTSVSLSTSSIGTPNTRIGSEFGDVNFFNGWIKYVWVYKGTLTAGQTTNMKTFLNVN